jgi:protein TonB
MAGSARPLEAPKAAIPSKAPAAAPTAQSDNAASSAPGESGSGSGASGTGSETGAGGGGGTPARRSDGALGDRDYPEAAARVRAAGTVFIRFRIGSDGRVHDCRVTRSSGFAVLDSTTCRLVEQRFRYIPARDGAGRAVDDSASTSFTWGPKE